MANLQLTPENWRFSPRRGNPQSSRTRNYSLKLSRLRLFTAKPHWKLRIVSGVKEKGDFVETQRNEVLSGLRVGEPDDNVPVLDYGDDQPGSSGESPEKGFSLNWPPWKDVPQRYKLIGTTSLAFVICNMDKVNLSVAIIPMSHQFGWNSSTAGLVQSSFFWGYALSQLPGGWLAKIFGGRKVLELGVLAWSLATIFVPLAAGFIPGLVLSRILVGIGEGVSPSAATDLIARSIPLEERSRAVAFVFGGLSVGSVIGLLLAPPFIQTYGWESVFYIFGFFGIIWCLGFEFIGEQPSFFGEYILRRPQNFATLPVSPASGTKSWSISLNELAGTLEDVPWKAFFRSPAIWAMTYAHFCGSWGHYTCLSWLPTYFSEELNLNLTEAAWVSVLPPLASIVVTNLAAQFADYLISRGVQTTRVRKVCQTIAFLSPAACMIASSIDLGLPPWEVVGILTGGLALSSFALSGLYCTHQDISPEYASILLNFLLYPCHSPVKKRGLA